jgi:16S rRNA processing protein RimM
VRGEVIVELYTDFPERLTPGLSVFAGEAHERLTISSRRAHKEGLLVSFEGLDTPELAGRYRNQILYVVRADSPELPPGEYYHHQLLGIHVVDDGGVPLGTLTEIIETGANDVYAVAAASGAEVLIPAIPQVVLGVDLEARIMRVHLLPGLLGEE